MFGIRLSGKIQESPHVGAKTIAVMNALEGFSRAILSSLYPILLYRTLGSAEGVSHIYFWVGLSSVILALVMPVIMRKISRRVIYLLGAILMAIAPLFAVFAGDTGVIIALVLGGFSAVTLMICLNAYTMDHISKDQLGFCETKRLFYCATAWSAGPFVGVLIADTWGNQTTFVISSVMAVVLIVAFLYSGLGAGKKISHASRKAPNIIANIGLFLRQPRLVSGWIFSLVRSIGWFIIFVYLPIFAIEAGWGSVVGGLLVSICTGFLFVTPLILKWMNRYSVRKTIMAGFFGSSIFCSLAVIFWQMPIVAALALVCCSFFLIVLDVCGNLPFLMAAKPSQRADMVAVFSTYKDASVLIAPGLASLVLMVMPLSALFTVMAGMMGGGFWLGRYLHPRLGHARKKVAHSIRQAG